ncbi:M23 family metallopeptidase [Glutamicibacter sp. NPDC087661]|uniref:M23 family metallopeptidase n=1 Tax=Glutamicibacter sp. NPDC087661 TaxID=3363996 RepID=UPI0037F1607C
MQKLQWPLYNLRAPITQPYGANPRVYQRFNLQAHNGIDYGCIEGTAILSSAPGIVRFAGDGVGSPIMGASAGLCLLIEHEGQILTEYAHLSKIYVEEGQEVGREIIALSGATGAVSGDHLHWGVLEVPLALDNGYMGRVDPTPYLAGEVTGDELDDSTSEEA